MALEEILKQVAPAAVTGFVGIITTGLAARKTLKDEVASLKRQIEALFKERETEKAAAEKRAAIEAAAIDKSIAQLKVEFNRELQEVFLSLKTRSAEARSGRKTMDEIIQRLITMEASGEARTREMERLSEELMEFVREQQRQWQTMSAQMGNVEGYIRAITKKASGSFQSPNR